MLTENTDWFSGARADQKAFQVPVPIVGDIQLAEHFFSINPANTQRCRS
jgi:acetolactate synthase-1/2/3 large subunit